jgi:hypothetical protein
MLLSIPYALGINITIFELDFFNTSRDIIRIKLNNYAGDENTQKTLGFLKMGNFYF